MIAVCPKCDVALVLMEFKDIQVDFCPKCRGIWLDAGELEDLIKRTGAQMGDPLVEFHAAPVSETKTRGLCPRCDRRMREISKSCGGTVELRLDQCPHGHGLWFDANELKQLMASFPGECGTSKTLEYLDDVLGQRL
jgi:Zn-finger nucleic acid-binding protein